MPERLLLVQLADIGDLIVTTPAMSALRECFPQAHLTLLTSAHAAPLVENTGLVDEIIAFERKQFNQTKSLLNPQTLRRIFVLRRGCYDTVIFFHHFTLRLGTLKFALIALASGARRRIGLQNGNSWFLTDSVPDGGFGAKHQAQYWLDLVGLVGTDSSPRPAKIAVADIASSSTRGEGGESTVSSFLSHNGKRGFRGEGKIIVIHPGSGGYSLARRWDAAGFAAVADALHAEFNAQIVIVGSPGDNTSEVIRAMKTIPVDLTGKLTLPELAGVIHNADLFIGADSGVMHVAAAAGTPVLAIFGPSNHAAWSPWMPNGKSIVVRSAPECSPCSYVEHGVGLREGCPARTCMRMVTPEMVLNAARALLENNPSPSLPIDGEGVNLATRILLPSAGEVARSAGGGFANRLHILGFPVDAITYAAWLNLIAAWVKTGERGHHVCTINPEFIMIARQDVNFRNILKRADLCVPDGVGLLWAARRRGTPLPERVTGSDGVPIIAERAAQEGWRLFFLGAAPGVADRAADILREKHPGLQVVGVYSGSPAPEEEDQIVEIVNASRADILFVAYGAPNQDKWIARNLPRLQVKMAMGVGGAFDFIAGVIPRAPLWMRHAGIEWLYRLYLQPWRIRRMMRLPRFVLAVLLER